MSKVNWFLIACILLGMSICENIILKFKISVSEARIGLLKDQVDDFQSIGTYNDGLRDGIIRAGGSYADGYKDGYHLAKNDENIFGKAE